MGMGQPSPQHKHTQPQDGPALQGKARPGRQKGSSDSPPKPPWCSSEQAVLAWPGLGVQDRPALVEQPWLSSPGMHCRGQGESRGQSPTGAEGRRELGGHCPILLRLQSSPKAPPLTCSEGEGAGKCSLPDHNAYVGKEGGKGEEEEYIPSRTVNHAE